MRVKDLQAGVTYYYTAGAEWVEVKYIGRSHDGYEFTSGGVRNELNRQSVEQYIKEK